MNTAEVVKREVQGNGSFQVRQFLTVGVREPRQSAKLHPHCKVLPFHVARSGLINGSGALKIQGLVGSHPIYETSSSRNVADAGISDSNLGYNLRDSWWGVPPFIMLPKIPKQLYELRKIHVQTKDVGNRLRVEVEAVRSQLDLLCKALVQIANESHGVRDAALPDAIRCDQLGVSIKCDENPLVAYFYAIIFANVVLLFAYKGPGFIALYIAAIEIAQSYIHQSFASFAHGSEQTHDCVPIQTSETFRGTNRTAFKKASNRTFRRIRSGKECVASQGVRGVRRR